jgi:hypothetical protein
LRSASSRPLWLLLSAATAFVVLAWSAQRPPTKLPGIQVRVYVTPEMGSSALTYIYSPAGKGFFRRVRPATLISGVDTITQSCLTFTWGRGGPSSTTVSQCTAGRSLRKLP